jgi:hypothetical protein
VAKMPKNVLGTTRSTSFHGSTGHKIFGSDGSLYQGGAQMFSTKGVLQQNGVNVFSTDGELIQNSARMIQAISYSSAFVFDTTQITPGGFTYIYPADYTKLASSDRGQISLDSPKAGVRKTISYDGGSTNTIVDVALIGASIFGTSDWSTVGTTSKRYIHFSSAVNDIQSITMLGLSTNLWAVESILINSTVAPNWGNAAGIRTSTAVRSS